MTNRERLWGFEIEDLLDGDFALTEIDAPERSTGWKDGYRFDSSKGVLEFFDAEQNELFLCSPIRELDLVIDCIQDEIDDARWDEDDREYDDEPYRRPLLCAEEF